MKFHIPSRLQSLTFISALTLFNRFSKSGVVTFLINSIFTSIFCHVGDFGCGVGSWTPVMKIDGKKVFFFSIYQNNLLIFLITYDGIN